MKSRPSTTSLFFAIGLLSLPAAFAGACSATSPSKTFGDGGAGGEDPSGGTSTGTGNSDDGGFVIPDAGDDGGGLTGDPKTCAEAANARTYIGCDFWPTVVGNNVWSVFDYAVVVANAGDQPADITVTRGGATVAQANVPPNELAKVYLPWVPELKGPDANACGSATPISQTVRVTDGAYHLVSSRPVTVYQFNALEYAPQGGAPGKNWDSCPASGCGLQCFSYSNDASLLLPSTAMTGNYRITGYHGWPLANMGPYFAITGTQNGTSVQVKLSQTADVLGGGGIQSAGGGQVLTFSLNQGEVVELVGSPSGDTSGTQVYADKPVQVIHGIPCTQMPEGVQACDHIEESVFPAETLGKHYFVTVPTGPNGDVVGHVVRIYGNVDGTNLKYPGPLPDKAPLVVNAGQVLDLGQVSTDFEIIGDHEFGVGSFMLGAGLLDPNAGVTEQRGDPAQSLSTAVEQYRTKYVFLAPDDYDISYVDVVQPMTAKVVIDDAPVNLAPQQISSNYGIVRVKLGPGKSGAHVLTSTDPVGIQVMGYGRYTSYQYPGGLNLSTIAPPPPPPK
jgi:hypothetical protein